MLRGILFWGWSILFIICLTITPNIGHSKSNDSLPPGDELSNDQFGTDYVKKYLTKSIKVRVIRLCNDDGSDAGAPSLYYVNKGIEEANKVLYDNSGGNIVYHLDPETNLNECVHDSLANYDCHLNPDYFPGKNQVDITAADLENLTEADLNQDGEYDKYDIQHLCDTSKQGVRRKSIAYDHVGSLVVFVRGLEARRRVKYDEELGHWIFAYPSGGYSSCAGNLVVMNSGYWGNLLAHETGHYLCNPHTFSRNPKDKDHAAEQIVAVIDKYNLDPTDKEKVLIYTFDGDHWSKVDFLGDHRILDTPPDPRGGLWKSEFGNDLCLPENDLVSVYVSEHNQTYDLQPDRSLIMSYFKGCTALGQHFSPHQVERIELSLDNHRQHLVNKNVVDCYYGKYNGTDWEGMDHLAAFNKKAYYLNQCQTPPDLEALRGLADKKIYPKPSFTPDWSDPIKRIFLEDMENDEIQEEIDLDIEAQNYQAKNSFLLIENEFMPNDDVQNSKETITPEKNDFEAPSWFAQFLQGEDSL